MFLAIRKRQLWGQAYKRCISAEPPAASTVSREKDVFLHRKGLVPAVPIANACCGQFQTFQSFNRFAPFKMFKSQRLGEGGETFREFLKARNEQQFVK